LKAKLVISLAAVVAGLLIWAVPGSGVTGSTAAQKPQKVSVEDNFFDKRSVQVRPGEKVVWVWRGMNRHNVRFTKVPKGAVRGGSKIKTDGRWRRTFKVEGTYRYICKLFTGMRGTVTVRAEQPQPNSAAQ
jgi:plastocyanin